MNNVKHVLLLKNFWLKKNLGLKQELSKYADKLYPYSKLPNVVEFRIKKLSNHHPILLKEGIKKRLSSPEMEMTKGTNQRMNRYLYWSFKTLNRTRTHPQKF